MNRIGKPIHIPPETDIDLDIAEISEETIKTIKEIEEQQRAILAYCWHYYV